MRTRLLALSAVAALAFAGAGHAAPKPQVVDPKGDAIGLQPGTDVTSVLFEPIKTGRTTTGVRVTLALAGAPMSDPGILYRVFGEQSSCGSFQLSWSPGAALHQNQLYFTCGSDASVGGSGTYTIINVDPKTRGSSLVWELKLKMLPKEMRTGTMSELKAFVTVAEPLMGILNVSDFVHEGSIDLAQGDALFRY